MTSCRDAGKATDGENDGDDEDGGVGASEEDAHVEVRVRGGRTAEDGEDGEPRRHLRTEDDQRR